MNELIEQIYLKLADLEKEIFPGLDELDYFEDNSTYLTIPDDVKFCTLDNCDLFILIHRSFYQDEDFCLFKTKIKQNKNLLNEILSNSNCHIDYLSNMDNNLPFNISITLDQNNVQNSIFDNENYINSLKKLIQLITYKYCDFIYSLKLLSKKNGKKIKDKEKIQKQIIQKFINSLQINQITNGIYNHYTKLLNDNNKFEANNLKKYNSYISLIKNLETFKIPFLIDITMINNIDSDIIFELYKKGLLINNEYVINLIDKKQKLLQNHNKLKKAELIKLGYNIENISDEKVNLILKYGNITEIKKIINFLNSLDYKLIDIYSNNGIYIIVNSKYEIVYYINELLRKNVINMNFISNHPNIFFDKDIINDVCPMYNTLKTNADLLNLTEIQNINELLLNDHNIMKDNVHTLNKYSKNLNANILRNFNLLDNVDLLIEFGLAKYIEDNIKIVTDDINLIVKRIYIAKLLNINIIQNNQINPILLEDEKFYVNNNDLEDYIINNVDDYIDQNIKNILDNNMRNVIDNNLKLSCYDAYLKDNLTYDFNGILISKNKLLRNLTCLKKFNLSLNDDLIFNSILYGSILDSEKIEALKNLIYGKKYLKK